MQFIREEGYTAADSALRTEITEAYQQAGSLR